MAKVKFRGISTNQEFRSSAAARDIRPMWKQIYDACVSYIGAPIAIIVLCVAMFTLPELDDLFFILCILIFWLSMWKFKTLPFKLPAFSHKLDPNDLNPGTGKPMKSSGLYFFGNEVNTKHQLWFNNADMRTHTLIFGSTGSGKTEAMVSLAYNALVQGSGFIYVDGKGDNTLFSKIFSVCRAVGREDDLLVINFMTGARDITGPQEHVLSNTLNPFAAGSSSMLSNLVVSLMDSGGGSSQGGGSDGDMWKGRAISFVEALMRPLVYLRDEGHILLEAGLIRKYFTLDVLEGLLYDKKVIDQNNNTVILDKPLPFDVRDPVENYLATLPGYQKSEKGKQNAKAYEQHGYITMQLTRIFGSLADVYAHIIRTNLAEVDFKDVVLNRRILVVLLPALEKSPDELANLGKLIIASLKAMLASGLGEKIEGKYSDVIESKPTNSKSPYLCVLDEYGYYAVKGFAVVPAQARSLGFSVVFAGQDLPAFQKASKEEAASICANTNVKICMKLEDPQETWKFFQETAAETYVAAVRGFNYGGQSGSALSYKDNNEAMYDKRARIDLLDLKDQGLGDAHIFFKSKIVRAKMFYADPPKTKYIRVNQFIKVKPPSEQSVDFLASLHSQTFTSDSLDRSNEEESLQDLFDICKTHSSKKDINQLLQATNDYIDGHKDDEEIDFGDQTTNPSIFMTIPVDERLGSDFFDVEVSDLQDCLLGKERLYEVVKRLAIIEGRSEAFAKSQSNEIIKKIEFETDYSRSYPTPAENIIDTISAFITNTENSGKPITKTKEKIDE